MGSKKAARSVSKYVGKDDIIDVSHIVRPRKPKIKSGKTLQSRMNYHDKMVGYYHRMKQYHIAMYYSPESKIMGTKKNKK